MSKMDDYVKHRLNGVGVRKAARAANYSGGTPSPAAYALAGVARAFQKAMNPLTLDSVQNTLKGAEKVLDGLEKSREQAKADVDALRLIREVLQWDR